MSASTPKLSFSIVQAPKCTVHRFVSATVPAEPATEAETKDLSVPSSARLPLWRAHQPYEPCGWGL